MSCSYKLNHSTFSLSSSLQNTHGSTLLIVQKSLREELPPTLSKGLFERQQHHHSFEMDRLASFGGNIKLPVGYTFCPSDEVFVAYYLKKKALSRRSDVEVVPEFDVFSTEPKNLPSGGRVFLGNKFFFCDLKDRVLENIEKRDAGSGQWRTSGDAKDIILVTKNRLVGRRNKLVFWRKRGTGFIKTRWIMHEFRLYLPAALPDPSQMSSWAGYKIFLKKDRKSNKRVRISYDDVEHSDRDDSDEFEEEEEEDEEEEPSEVNFALESGSNTGPPSPSSSDSDSVTSQ